MRTRFGGRRGRVGSLTVSVVLVASLVSGLALPGTATADGPSVTLPATPSTPVSRETMGPREADQATLNALRTEQQPRAAKEGSGKYTASSLTPSASWDVALYTGDFTWSYPMRVPPAPGGLEPNLALGYRSAAVDGRTSAVNPQPSWVGDGWDLVPGYVERTYGACFEDTGDAVSPPPTGDLCWRSDNATASYGGSGGALIHDERPGRPHGWHPQADDGSRVEQAFNTGNGARDGESWKITTVDGTQYFFGSEPGSGSTWTVPVFGDDPGEPCHASTFDASRCVQGWRWNLDKVIDRNGNVVRYFYDKETNSYGVNGKDAAVSYVRGGALRRIEYGLNTAVDAPASARVLFETAERCVPGTTCDWNHPGNLPDTPIEDNCGAATCPDHHSPTFWSSKRLASVTTEVRRGDSYQAVDRWTLEHQFPETGDGSKPAMWLRSIVHSGLVGSRFDLPAVVFEGSKLPNRVRPLEADGVVDLIRYRITGVVSEAGGVLTVNYGSECKAGGPMPTAPEANTLRCFPVHWAKKDFAERADWFHKYVVESVVQSDRIASNPPQETRYEYLDGAGWHWDTSEFVKEDKKTWNEFRGFGRVRVRVGKLSEFSGPMTMSEQRFYRGMDGDKLPNGTRRVQVSDTEGGVRADSDWLQGFGFETDTFERAVPVGSLEVPPVVGKTISDPYVSEPTAVRGPFRSYIVRTAAARGYTALASGGWRVTRTETSYNDKGLPTDVSDLGEVGPADDDRCSHTDYAPNEAAWLMNLPRHVGIVSVRCGQTARYPDDALGDVQNTFDGNGNLTQVEVAEQHPAAGPLYVTTGRSKYDKHGRVIESTDALDHTAKVAYTPVTGGPVTATTATSPGTDAVPGGLVTTTTLDPAWGVPVKVVDPNDFVTELTYDPLGRGTEVWLPNRPRGDETVSGGNLRFAYQIRNDDVSVVTSTRLGPNGRYVSSNTLYDGWLRVRQAQAPAFGGGRLLTDTRYDSHGRAWKTTQPYFNDAAVDTTLWVASDTAVPGHTRIQYDGAGRAVASIYYAGADPLWQTTTHYGGDRVHVTPPAGGTATTTIDDARGQTTELRQYQASTPDGEYDATRYTYTKAGQLASITDPARNTWRYAYDLRGRQLSAEDPDRGTSTMSYNNADQLTTLRDSRSKQLAFTYDPLGRKTGTFRDRVGGMRLAEWTYDTVASAKGQPATATRFVDGHAYTSAVTAYSTLYQPAVTSVTIPENEGLLAGTYTTSVGFKQDGTLAGMTIPAAGGLAEEKLTYGFADLGQPTTTVAGMGGKNTELVGSTDYTRYGEMARVQLGAKPQRAWLTYLYQTSTRRLDRTIVDAEVPRPSQADVQYTYDPAGNITSTVDTPQAAPVSAVDTQCFGYDYLRRLRDAWTPASGGCGAAPGALGGPAPYRQSFTYDKVGNRLTETSGDTTRDYTYGLPQPHALASVTTRGPGITALDQYTYDSAGNTRTRTVAGTTQTLDWDEEGHLTKVASPGSETSFVYSADGTRLLRRDPTATTLYLGNQELTLNRAGGNPVATRYYAHGGATIAMRKTTGGLTWLASDHQGTAQISINSTTLEVTRRRQLPFGSERGPATPWPNDKAFLGGTADPSTGLTHLGARSYDPTIGRFVSVDPILEPTNPQQLHGYSYAENNPTTFSDPTGLSKACADDFCQHSSTTLSDGSYHIVNIDSNTGQKTTKRQQDHNTKPVKGGGCKGRCVTHDLYISTPVPRAAEAAPVTSENAVLCAKSGICGKAAPQRMSREEAGVEGALILGALCLRQPWSIFGCVQDGYDIGTSVYDELAGPSPVGGLKVANTPCSFTGDTQILMADGSTKPIAEVKVGDKIIAADPETGEKGPREVTAVLTHEDTVVDLVTEGGARVTTTRNHPFWDATDRRWERADQLDPGDDLLTATGEHTRIVGLTAGEIRPATTYNLTVQGVHTYYVGVKHGFDPVYVLVHNTCENPKSFPNLVPGDAPFIEEPQTALPAELRGKSGVLPYVVEMDGRLVVGAVTHEQHINLAQGKRVRAAGVVHLRGGDIVGIDNDSGHYKPYGTNARDVAEKAFFEAGFGDAFGKYREVPDTRHWAPGGEWFKQRPR